MNSSKKSILLPKVKQFLWSHQPVIMSSTISTNVNCELVIRQQKCIIFKTKKATQKEEEDIIKIMAITTNKWIASDKTTNCKRGRMPPLKRNWGGKGIFGSTTYRYLGFFIPLSDVCLLLPWTFLRHWTSHFR